MTGRNRCLMAFHAAVFAALGGCSWSPKQPALPTAPPPMKEVSKSVTIPEPVDEPSAAKKGPLAPATLLVFADTWVDSVANDPSKPPPERERLLSQARQYYNEVLQREPKNVDALLGMAKMYQVTGESERLADTERRMKEHHPNNAKIWAWIAVRQGQSKDWEAAAESYQKAVNLDPDNRLYRIHLGFTLARGGHYDEGLSWLNKSMRESEARFNLAMMMIHNQKPELARRQLNIVLQMDPSFRQASEQLAAMDNGDYRGAPPGNFDAPVRTVGFTDQPAPVIVAPPPPPDQMIAPQSANSPRRTMQESAPPRPMSDPMPLGVGGRLSGNLPPAYTATTGWDTTIPPNGRR